MSNTLQYTTMDAVFAKVDRDLKGSDFDEGHVIEWVGEALGFMKIPQIQEQAVAFMEVKDYQINVPDGFRMVLQISRNNDWTPETKEECLLPVETVKEVEEATEGCSDCFKSEPLDCNGKPLFSDGCGEYRPYFDMQWQYIPWTATTYYKNKFTPVRLSNHTFFNTLVCKEKENTPYQKPCGEDEYTIVGTTNKAIRFSFKEGYVALAYLRTVVDSDTGYPLIPDDSSCLSALMYYIKWKIAEGYDWIGREGWSVKADKAEAKWNKYVRQFNNYMKMPKSLDEFQNLLEQSHYLIPRHKRFANYFGKLGREEYRGFNGIERRRF